MAPLDRPGNCHLCEFMRPRPCRNVEMAGSPCDIPCPHLETSTPLGFQPESEGFWPLEADPPDMQIAGAAWDHRRHCFHGRRSRPRHTQLWPDIGEHLSIATKLGPLSTGVAEFGGNWPSFNHMYWATSTDRGSISPAVCLGLASTRSGFVRTCADFGQLDGD